MISYSANIHHFTRSRKGTIQFLFIFCISSVLHEPHHFMKFSQYVVDNLFTMIMCNLALKG